MTDDKVTDIAARIVARAAGEQSLDRIVAGIQILARAFEDMRAAGLDNPAIARLLRHVIEGLDKHAIEEFEE
jgi:hypothetical protein